MNGPLDRFVILDASASIAGRYCARLFARLGAQVYRNISGDDGALGRGGAAGIAFGRWLDQGKRTDPHPADIALAIVERGGAVPDGALRLEIDWFATSGPYANWQANDPVIQALIGLTHGFGPAEGPPLLAQGHSPQIVAGAVGFIAALGALIGRERGADADRAEVSIFEAACCFSEPNAVSYAHFGHAGSRMGINRYVPTYPCSIYRTRDGWLGVTCLTPAQWEALTDMIGRPELANDPRFITTLDRLAHADLVDEILRPALADREAIATAEAGQARRIPMAAVPDLADLPTLPHWQGRGSFDADGTPGLPFRLAWDGHGRALPPIAAKDLPLAGLRVVDFTMGWAGPLCTRTLADLGAEVVKIESEVRPDWWRGWERPEPGVTVEAAPVFSVVNRGKRGVLIDLKTPEGMAQAEALIRGADVVVENFAPGVLAKLGLSTARLRELRPGLVSVSMGAFGAVGPWSGFRAYGSTVEQASGIPTINGSDAMPPALQHIAYGDPVAGLYAAVAVLAALAGRERQGGCDIDLAQVETLFQLSADAIIARALSDTPLARTGSRRAMAAPCACVATAETAAGEDRWIAIACHDEAAWQSLCRVLDRTDWANDPALASVAGRNAQGDMIERALADWAAARTSDAAVATLQAAGVPATPVVPIQGLVDDPQLRQSGYWIELERAHMGRHLTGAAPFLLDGQRPCAASPAPLLGEHHDDVIGAMPETIEVP